VLARIEMTLRPPHVFGLAVLADTPECKMGAPRIRLEKVAQTHKVVVCRHEEQYSRSFVGVGSVLVVSFQSGEDGGSEVLEAVVGVGAGVDGGCGLETGEGLFDGAANAEG